MSRTLMAAEKEVPRLTDERRKALNLAITQIEKTCGKGAIMRMGADSPQVRVEAIPTGAINLDAAIGIGGIPRGRVSEIFGPESSGKTTLALDVVVVDSVAALVPKAEIEGEMGDSLPGLQARLMSQALRKLAGAINRSRT